MGNLIRMSRGQFRRARTLVRRFCANYDGGYCILLDDGEPCPCPQLLTPSLICRYFRSCVLPADQALFAEITLTRASRRCLICGAPIVSCSNAAKYCPRCAVQERRRKDAERKRKNPVHIRK